MRCIRNEQFADCVRQYQRLIFTICYSFTKNYFDAEDLAQETFLAAYNSMDRFDGKNLKAYLTTIAANKCRDYLRRAERKNVPLPEDADERVRAPDASPEEQLIDSDISTRIYLSCQKLEDPYRAVATGYFCEDEKLSDMALRTGENLRTLQTRLYRAKEKLKTIWKEDEYAFCAKRSSG